MAEAQLSVELTAKIDGLRDNFNTAIREVGKLDKDTRAKLSSIDKGFADLANSVEQNISGKLSGSVKATSTSVSKNLAVMAAASAKAGQGVAVGTNRAGQALTDLSRIAQDAPFGFIGIQNNIAPLIESFGRLKAESGSTGTALKSLLGGLVGPAGLGVAFSVVSAGILFYQQYQQRANKTVKEAKTSADDYINSLDQLSQVQLRGAENALKEQTELRTLYDITQNAAVATKTRLDAVNELQSRFPAYFKNISDENFLNGQAKSAYDELTVSILATARARAAQDLITKNSSRQLENESKITRLRIEQQKALNEERRAAKIDAVSNENATSGTGNIITAQALYKATERRLELDKQIYNITTDSNKLTDINLQLTKSINTEVAKGADLTGKVGAIDAVKKAKDIRTLSDVLKDLNIDLLQADNNTTGTFGDQQKDKVNAYQKAIDDLIKLGFDPANAAIVRLKKSQDTLFNTDAIGGNLLQNVPGLNTNDIASDTEPINIAPILDFTPVIVGKNELDKALEDLQSKKDQFLSLGSTFGMASSALSDGFASIGEGLASGGNVIEAFGQVVINAFGNFLAELGKQSIAEGLFHIAKGVAYSTNPFTAALAAGEFSSGAGLIAAGGLLSLGGGLLGSAGNGGGNSRSGGARQPTAFANGGIIYGPTLGLMGEYAGAKSDPEVVAPLSKLKSILGQSEDSAVMGSSSLVNGGNVVKNTSNTYGTNGSNGNIIVQAPEPIVMTTRFEISGEKLFVITERAKKRLGRVS